LFRLIIFWASALPGLRLSSALNLKQESPQPFLNTSLFKYISFKTAFWGLINLLPVAESFLMLISLFLVNFLLPEYDPAETEI